jgi:hypothetical protein
MTRIFRQCQSCPKQITYEVLPPIDGYSVGKQDVCPGCAVRRREYREGNAAYCVGKIGRRSTLARHEALVQEIFNHYGASRNV